jgi:Vanadium chloroperoxidase N-terminal domain
MQDPILYWNHQVNEANKVDHSPPPMKNPTQGGPTRSSRATAIAHLAMHDAFFGVAGGQALYLGASAPPAFIGANGLPQQSAAVAGAALTALTTLYPDQMAMFESASNNITDINGTDSAAFEYGRDIAIAILALRTGDGADAANPRAVYSSAKPHHRADPLNAQPEPLGAYWGQVKPFAVQNTAHAQTTPPAYDSSNPANSHADYKTDHDEVTKKGGAANQQGVTRTREETVIGLYWAYDGARNLGTPPRLYNQIVRKIAMSPAHLLTTAENARLFALVNVAMGDAGIRAWHWKYVHDLWRPVLGIREYDNNFGWDCVGGQPIAALCDPFWRPLGAPKTNDPGAKPFTPPFPAYPSGHATFGAAVFEMVRKFYKAKNPVKYNYGVNAVDNIDFEFVSDELNGVSTDNDGALRTRHERSFASVADAMYENSVSRIFLGVHWRFDGTSGKTMQQMLTAGNDVGGVPLGRAIASDIFTSGMIQSP